MCKVRVSLIQSAVVLTLLSGCMVPAPNGNSNANLNANGAANQNANSTAITLTAAQQAAIDEVVAQIESAAAVFATFGGLVNDEIDFNNLAALGLIGVDGTCPQFSFVNDSQNAQFVLGLVFNPACTTDKLAGAEISGEIALRVTRATRTADITFTNFTVDGQTIAGTAALQLSGNNTSGVTLAGTVDLEIGAAQTVRGDVRVAITSAGVITVNSDGLDLSDGSDVTSVEITDLVIDPVGNGNFVPEAGSIAFEDGGPPTITVTFSTASPATGTVTVTVGNLGATTYQIPGVGA